MAALTATLAWPGCMSTAHDCMPSVSVARKLRALQSSACYPVPAASVELIETHFAWVFMVGDYAYKMKKPVAYPRSFSPTVRSEGRWRPESARVPAPMP